MNNTEIAINVVEGLLIELAEAGHTFSLTAELHEEPGFFKPKNIVRLADGSWESESVEVIVETLAQRADLVELQLRTRKSHTSLSGTTVTKQVGLTQLDLSAGPAVIETLGLLGTREYLVPFCKTAVERAEAACSDQLAA